MILKYRYGNPIATEAVVTETEPSKEALLHFTKEQKDGIRFHYPLAKEDIVYGLGETVRGINKRGWKYISSCADDPVHTEGKRSLYGAHNFLVVSGKETFGVFVDHPGKVAFDIGAEKMDELTIHCETPDLDLYIIEGESVREIVKAFRRMIGKSYLPPKWAFGYQQSRWGYENADDIRTVVRRHRDNHIPLDAVYMDIDYMEAFKDFTVDKRKFPDFPSFVREMKAEGIRLVPIIDAGVRIEEGYEVYEEGIRNGYFCKDINGNPFTAAVWPGKVHFPDVLNPEARAWFGNCYKTLLDQGIEGFWNDMNEPAIFYSEQGLQAAWAKAEELRGKNMDLYDFFALKDAFLQLSNSDKDYQSFYHEKDGQSIRHDLVHNLYGYNMTRAAAEAFDRLRPNVRTLLFSRASYIGMHRVGGIWTGDNESWWSHILLSIQQMPALNMCGFLYTGSDIGGFGDNTTRDLLLRWLEFAIFTPLMRNHSAMGTREQEVYRFEQLEEFRNIIELRYALLPYIYSEFMKAAMRDEMYFRALAFDYPQDEQASRVEDQLLVGDSVMIAPVYQQNAKGRYVYLPEEMKQVRFKSASSYTEEILPAGHHYVEMALDEVVLFIRPDKAVPMAEPAACVEEMDFTHLTWLTFVKTEAVYELYDDDGVSKAEHMKEHIRTYRF